MIEEPPEKTLFLLVSEEPDKVIPTIMSRCQLVKVPSFRAKDIISYIQSRYNIDDKQAADIAKVSNGNIVRSVEMCKSLDSNTLNLERFKSLMRFAWKRDIISIISWSEEIAAIGREPQKNFIAFALRLVRENLMLTLGQMKNSIVYLTGEEASFHQSSILSSTGNVIIFAEELNLAYSMLKQMVMPKYYFSIARKAYPPYQTINSAVFDIKDRI
jgi:DNA polymerase-3 subunit delta'